ncbi:MAG: hypothetical protein ACXWK6_00925 [Myxococcaceae bacterium]
MRTTLALALALMVSVVLGRTLPFLGPVPPEGLFSSDSAIPVLMCNLATAGPVDWLFWGQDRFGSWPFLIARAGGALTGRTWMPHGLHVARVLWMMAAVVPWVALAGRAGAVAAAGLLLLPVLSPVLGRVLVDLATVDGWQLPSLLWAWWGLREAARSARPAPWLCLGVAAGVLATWTSLVSAPLLIVLAVVEGTARGVPGRRRALLALPALGGLAVESGVRAAWHAAVRARGWRDVRTPARLDAGHLLENLRQVLAVAWHEGAIPWLLAALAAVAVLLAARRAVAPERRTVVGAGAAALTALLIVVAVRHVRENAYHPRYLGVGLALAVLAVSVTAGLVLHLLAARISPRAAALCVGLAGVLAVVLGTPAAAPDPRETVLGPAVAQISARFPGAVLAASYWRTYALAALLPPWSVIPVPKEGDWNRRPDWVPFLGSGRPVLVGRPDTDPGPPPATLRERGADLVLVEPDVLHLPPFPAESTGERLSLYRAAPPTR